MHEGTGLYPEAKAAIVTELVNQEVNLLATKMPLVLTMKLPFSRSIDQTCRVGVVSALRVAVGVVQMTGEDNTAYEGLDPFY